MIKYIAIRNKQEEKEQAKFLDSLQKKFAYGLYKAKKM